MTQVQTSDLGGMRDARENGEGAFLAALGRRVRRLRLLAELTQTELAAATGMSRSFVRVKCP
jgi:DNA-binding XRE family transcriptional regulator